MDPRLFSLADEQLFPDLRGQLGASLDQLERCAKLLELGRRTVLNAVRFSFSARPPERALVEKEKRVNCDELAVPYDFMQSMMPSRGGWLSPSQYST